MRIPRLYLDQALQSGLQCLLSTQQAHYLSHVLRLGDGHPLIIFNGSPNREWLARLEVRKKHCAAIIETEQQHSRDVSQSLHLLQALAKSDHTDWILQKGTELGVSHFHLFFSARSQKAPKAAQWQKRLQHWQGVMISACEQCGRSELPQLRHYDHVTTLLESLAAEHQAQRFLLNFTGQSCRDLNLNAAQPVFIACGAEGGFTEEEIAAFQNSSFRDWCLGARILRTETAAIAAVAQMQCLTN